MRRLVLLPLVVALLMPLAASAHPSPTVPSGACADVGLHGTAASQYTHWHVDDGPGRGLLVWPSGGEVKVLVAPHLRDRELVLRSFSRDLRLLDEDVIKTGGRITRFRDGSWEVRWRSWNDAAAHDTPVRLTPFYRDGNGPYDAEGNALPGPNWHRLAARAVGSRCSATLALVIMRP